MLTRYLFPHENVVEANTETGTELYTWARLQSQWRLQVRTVTRVGGPDRRVNICIMLI